MSDCVIETGNGSWYKTETGYVDSMAIVAIDVVRYGKDPQCIAEATIVAGETVITRTLVLDDIDENSPPDAIKAAIYERLSSKD